MRLNSVPYYSSIQSIIYQRTVLTAVVCPRCRRVQAALLHFHLSAKPLLQQRFHTRKCGKNKDVLRGQSRRGTCISEVRVPFVTSQDARLPERDIWSSFSLKSCKQKIVKLEEGHSQAETVTETLLFKSFTSQTYFSIELHS